MKIKKLIKILKQYNKNRSVKLHTSTCIEDILKVDQSYDADYDEVYLTGNLENASRKFIDMMMKIKHCNTLYHRLIRYLN